MTYWVREKGGPPFHGPFTLIEVAVALTEGQFSIECELLPAEGQSFGVLKRTTNWKSVKEFNLIKHSGKGIQKQENTQAPIVQNRARVFISYRREDSQDVTGRIYDRLVDHFSSERIFKDVDNIPLGLDFRTVLDDAIGKAGVVLVIIGPNWLTCADATGRRLDSPTDFVRLEVETALKKNLPVVPVVVGHDRMPAPDELPESINQLPYRNGIAVRPDPDFNHDMERLTSAVEQWISSSNSNQKPGLNQTLSALAREKEVERIDREWAEEREKYLITVMKGQTFVDGQMTGGYPVREVPTRTGSAINVIAASAFGLIFTSVGGFVVGGIFGVGFGVTFALVGLLITYIVVVRSVQLFQKVNEYEAAEAAYRKRREEALNGGETLDRGQKVSDGPNEQKMLWE